MKTSNYKTWLYSGIVILVISFIGGLVGVIWGISSSFSALKTNESAGIGAVGDGIYMALIFNIIFVLTGLVGMIFLVIGGIKGYKHSRPAE